MICVDTELRLALSAAEDIRALKAKSLRLVEELRAERGRRIADQGQAASAEHKVRGRANQR